MLEGNKTILGVTLIAALCLLLGSCKKDEETEVHYPVNDFQPDKGKGDDMRPHVPVLKISAYAWLQTANISMGRQNEISWVKGKIENYYSGYPSFLKVLKLITRDRNVGLKDNPAYLTDVFSKYYELTGADENDPFLVIDEYDSGILKNALYLSWKAQNEFSPIDNYDDMVTSANYGK